jgi:chaperonin GroEL
MIIMGSEVKEKLLEGINLVADTVKPTLGPQAKTVILQGNPPVIINDGVTITKYISHSDPYVQMGIQLVQNLALKAQSSAGDGTTTACIIAQTLCQQLSTLKITQTHQLKRELESVRNHVLNSLSDMSTEVTSESIVDVATIASNNDVDMGKLIAEVLDIVGKDGVITVEEGHQLETTYEVKEGLEVDEGFFSHLMANQPSGICELENPLVLCSNKNITNFSDLLPVLELCN